MNRSHSSLELSCKTSSIDLTLQQFCENEERDLIPYEFREEIISRALDIIEEKYMKKQTVKFVVHCAYEAMLKVLNINFMYHQPVESDYSQSVKWAPDAEAEPSAVDSWTCYKVPIKEKQVEEAPKEIIEEEIRREDYESESSLTLPLIENSDVSEFTISGLNIAHQEVVEDGEDLETIHMNTEVLAEPEEEHSSAAELIQTAFYLQDFTSDVQPEETRTSSETTDSSFTTFAKGFFLEAKKSTILPKLTKLPKFDINFKKKPTPVGDMILPSLPPIRIKPTANKNFLNLMALGCTNWTHFNVGSFSCN